MFNDVYLLPTITNERTKPFFNKQRVDCNSVYTEKLLCLYKIVICQEECGNPVDTNISNSDDSRNKYPWDGRSLKQLHLINCCWQKLFESIECF